MKPRGTLEISQAQFKKNISFYQELINPCQIIAVIKADAYGIGYQHISKLLKENNITYVAVIETDVAINLKKDGFDVLLLGNPFDEDLEEIINNEIKFCVSSIETVRKVISNKYNKEPKFILEFETGMGRLGFLENIELLKQIKPTGIMSHLSSAATDDEYTKKQIDEFAKIYSQYPDLETHLANSDGVYNFPELYKKPYTHVRIGIGMYGLHNFGETKECLKLKSEIIQIRNLPAGSGIGYDKTYVLEKDTLVGTIPLGYADGIPLQISNKAEVRIDNKLCRVIGKISMDFFTVDLSQLENPYVGQAVEILWDKASFDNWVKVTGTHYYNILCSLGKRIKRSICID